jgi:rhodanese-related sulfurtransferase
VGRDDEDARLAGALAESVGVTRLAGYLAGGMTSWREERRSVERIERITVPELRERADEVQILDVRELDEWEGGHIAGSVHVPYHDIKDVPDGIDPDRPVAVICSSGQRAAPAAGLLRRFGAGEVLHVVDGGVPRWRREGGPIDA